MELTEQQLRYLNGTALQMLMELNPEFKMKHKRKIYKETITALMLHISEEYWRLHREEIGDRNVSEYQ